MLRTRIPRAVGRAARLVGVVFVLPSCSPRDGSELAYPLTRLQRESVTSLLRANALWRVALPSDGVMDSRARNVGGTSESWQFFATGDLPSADADFAIALVRDSVYRVYHARWSGAVYQAPQMLAEASWFREAQLRIEKDTLTIAPAASDEVLRFVWSKSKRRMEFQREPEDSTIVDPPHPKRNRGN